jgi:hypothetical protein
MEVLTPTVMKKSAVTNHERHLKWEKVKVDKAVQEKILEHAGDIVDTLLDIGLVDRNPNVLNSLLDRAFGKARQNIGLDGGAEDKPIVFMPAVLMSKYAISPAKYTELESPQDGDDPTQEPVAMLREPIDTHDN